MKTFYETPNACFQAGARRSSRVVRAGSMLLLLFLAVAHGYAQTPPAASVSTKVQVPASMRTAPFNVDRYLTVPPNFSIAVYARVSKARFMAVAPNGALLVSQPSTGKVVLVRPNSGGDPIISDFATGLRNPHDIVFHTINNVTYVYIAESHQINRYTYTAGDLTAQNRQIVISGLPDASTPELQGNYGHQLKNIAIDGNHKLYVSIASTCNACVEDTKSDPIRGAIYQYNADGTGRRLFAQGLRNAEGLAFVPGTNRLWVVVNNRDNIAYPFNNDFDGNGTNDYGRVMTSYVDNHPPEEFTYVQDGGNYGWPFCNPNPDQTLDNMPFDRDYEFNRDGQVDCNGMTRISRGIQAHSAPLGVTFMGGTNFASPYRNGAASALHGSWNRSVKTGYKVVYFPWNATSQTPTTQLDLVTGFLGSDQSVLGRPVDVAVDLKGDMLISDDYNGTIYKLSYLGTPETLRTPENPTSTVAGLNYQYYHGTYSQLPDFNALTPVKAGTVGNFDLSPRTQDDYFAIRYTGYVSVPTDGQYTFYTTSDDGSRLFIGNQLVVDNDGIHGAQERSGTIGLKAGKHALSVAFFERIGAQQTLTVSYQGPGVSKQLVPASALSYVPAPATAGLQATYYNSMDLSGSAVLSRTDANVDVDWGNGSPASVVNVDRFSARWTGQVQAPVSGSYVFSTVSDDGVRLWVNGQQVINNWTDHPPTTNQSAAVNLVAGQKYDIRLEYFENGGGAVCRLRWSYPGQAAQAIPTTALSQSSAAAALRARPTSASLATQEITVFPNPAGNQATLSFVVDRAQEVSVQVTDVLSRVVISTTKAATSGANSIELSTAALKAGTYVVTIRKAGDPLSTRLVIAR